MVKKLSIRVLGIAATIVGMSATLISSWVDEKKMEEKVEEKVNEALARTQKGR